MLKDKIRQNFQFQYDLIISIIGGEDMNSREYEIIMSSKKYLSSEKIEEKEKGITMLEELANEKNKYALYELAMLYKEGKIVDKNIKKACNLFVFSGELGNDKGYYEAGKIFLEIKDEETAKRFFEKAKFSSLAKAVIFKDSLI